MKNGQNEHHSSDVDISMDSMWLCDHTLMHAQLYQSNLSIY